MRRTEVQQGVRDCFIVKLIPDRYSKRGWNHPWHPLLPTHINYFRICLVIHAENPTQNEWGVSFMQLLVKALQGVKSRLDLNWSQQYRIRSSGDQTSPRGNTGAGVAEGLEMQNIHRQIHWLHQEVEKHCLYNDSTCANLIRQHLFMDVVQNHRMPTPVCLDIIS